MPNKVYKITGGAIDGEVTVSCDDIAKYSGLSRSTVYSRLARGIRDLEKLSRVVRKRPPSKSKQVRKVKPVSKIFTSKPFYDPMFRLMLKSI